MYALIIERVSGRATIVTSEDVDFFREQFQRAKAEPQGKDAKTCDRVTRVRILVISHVIDDWYPTQLLGR